MFGSPTVAQLEDPTYKAGIVGMKKVDRRERRRAGPHAGRPRTPPASP